MNVTLCMRSSAIRYLRESIRPRKAVIDGIVLRFCSTSCSTFGTACRPKVKLTEAEPQVTCKTSVTQVDAVATPVASEQIPRVTESTSRPMETTNRDCSKILPAPAEADSSLDYHEKMEDSRPHLKRKEFSGKTKKGKKLDKHPKKIPKFSNDQKFNETTFYFENGLRKVTPYVYVFETHIKGRWIGHSLLDVFMKEFRMETPEYYKKAISNGLITINRQKASADKILQQNEFLRSMVHRHEPPVTGDPLDIITINDEFVVVNKPASIPVHPCGKYRHNTIIFMLGKVHGLTGLHTIHRLDRLTSGLLMFARTREVSQRIDAYVRDRKLTKVYVCKVNGEFPSDPIECTEPIQTVSHKIGVCRVGPDGKQCKTSFKRLSYDGQTSIVQCIPHTGRMHQIRVHLQYLGYPIMNDPLYNNPVWGPQLGKGGDVPHTDENQLLAELIKQHTAELQSQVIEDPDDFIRITRPPPAEDCDAQNVGSTSNEQVLQNERTGVKQIDNIKSELENPTAASTSEALACPSHKQSTPDVSVSVSEHHARHEGSTDKLTETGVCERSGDHLKSSDEPNAVESDRTSVPDQAGPSSQKCDMSPPDSENVQEPEHHLEPEKEFTEEELRGLVQSLCRECRLKLRDPKPEEMIMYLHALSYKGPDFEFSTPLPKWAEEHMQRSTAADAPSN